MRSMLIAAAALLTAGIAAAQYKTPPAQLPQPGSVQATPNPNLQITYPNPDDELATARRIPREEAIKMVKEGKAVYIDVRSKDAYDAGHIPGAMSVPLNELQSELNKLPKRKFLIPYCS